METCNNRTRQELVTALAAAEMRFEEALQSARHILYSLNVQQGGYDYLSPFVEELTGHPLAEFQKYSLEQLAELFHSDDRQRIFAEQGVLAQAVNERNGNKSFLLVEYRLRKADGTYCWLRDQNTIHFTEDGQIERIVGSAYDISEQKAGEEKLRQSETTFRALFETMHEGFAFHEVICNEQGEPVDYRYLDINPAFERLTGLQRDATIGRRVREVIPGIEERWITTFGRVALTGEPAEVEDYVLELDRYYRAKAYSPERGTFAVVFAECTEQKKLLLDLEEQEAALRVLFESSQAGIILVDPAGRITRANQRMAEMFGCSMDELIGSSYPEHVAPDQRGIGDERMRQLILGGVDYVSTERNYLRKDGSNFWGLLSGRRHEDGEGRLISLVGHITDISDIKQAEDALKSSEVKFRTLVDCSVDVIFVLDSHGVFQFVSPAWEQHFGYPVSAVVGHEFVPFVHPDDVLDCATYLQQVLTSGQGGTSPPYRVRHADGTWRHFVANGTLYIGAGGAKAYLGIARDISGQKQAEEERLSLERQLLHAQKLESLGVLAGGIAHDFNNILTAIIGNAELALMKLNPESPAQENLVRIEKAAARAADLARQMLAYSGKGKFVVEAIDINRLVEEMGHMLEVSISKKAILRYNLTRPLSAVNVDATQIRQIIMNLVINASEAIGDRSGVIAITTGCLECTEEYLKAFWLTDQIPAGFYVSLEIADSGCGMDKGTLTKIFDPFYTTKFTGRGLGMAAVLGIVRGHKGAIKVYSEPGKGSSFKVLLPAGEKPAELFNCKTANDSWRGSGSALLVDDEETVRAVGSEMLRELGFEVVTANDGREAVDIFKSRNDIKVIILDLTMPHMDGEQCFRELRLLNPDVKVVMSSGFSEHEVTQKFAGKGLAGFVQKPYKMSELQEALKGITGQTDKGDTV